MEWIKSILGFYVNTIIIAFTLGMLVGNYFGVASEPASYSKLPGAFISYVIDGKDKSNEYFYGVTKSDEPDIKLSY